MDAPSDAGMKPDVRLERSSPHSVFADIFGTPVHSPAGGQVHRQLSGCHAGTHLDFGPIKRHQSQAILKVSCLGHVAQPASLQVISAEALGGQELARRKEESGYELTTREARAVTSLQAGKRRVQRLVCGAQEHH